MIRRAPPRRRGLRAARAEADRARGWLGLGEIARARVALARLEADIVGLRRWYDRHAADAAGAAITQSDDRLWDRWLAVEAAIPELERAAAEIRALLEEAAP